MKRLHPQIAGALAALAMLLPVSPAAHAAIIIFTWNNTGTDFATAGNWTPSGGPPGSSAIAQFDTLGTLADGTINNPSIISTSRTILQGIFGDLASGAGWSLSGTGSLTAGNSSGGLVIRAGANTSIDLGDGMSTSLTLTGASTTTSLNGAIDVGHSSTLTLTGNTIASFGTSAIGLRGGSLVLDNSAGNPASQRITGTGPINLSGADSTIVFKSASGGSAFTGLSGALDLIAGDSTIKLNQTGAGALAVTFGSLSRSVGGQVNFVNAGNGTLGGGGAGDPSIKFTTAPGTTNGVIALSNGSASLGFALYNGTDFANYDATKGVVAATSSSVSGALSDSPTTNINITANASTSAAASFNSVKINPGSAGNSLALSGGNLSTAAILLTGTNDFSITGQAFTSGGGLINRLIYVINPSTTLSISSNLAAANQGLTKAGAGFLTLTGVTNQVGFSSTTPITLAGGTMRVNSTNFDLTTAGAPRVNFRGGVLEYDVSGGSFSFTRGVGTSGAGVVNWTGSGIGDGGGGFSAYAGSSNGGNGNGNTLTVNLGGASATQTWANGIFVPDGQALIFGSVKSNSTVDFQNPISLGSLSGYGAREIKVIKGVGNAADKTIISGQITGFSSSIDLLKTGDGTLELDATNTYAGATQVREGKLILGNATDTLNDSGTVIVNGGELALGANSDTVGTVVLASGSITGTGGTLTGSSYNVRSGSVSAILGGAGNLTKNTPDTVTLSGANTYTGATIINNGTLSLDNAGSSSPRLSSTASITVNSGGTLLLASSMGSSNDRINNAATMFLNANGSSTVAFNTGGLSEHGATNNTAGIGALTLQSTSIIDMGNASSIIAFANSNSILGNSAAWSGTLKIYDWSGTPTTGGGTDQLFIGNDGTGLSLTQLAEFQFYSGFGTGPYTMGAIQLPNGEIVPTGAIIPEPSTWLASTLALAVLSYKQRRRVARVFKSV